MGAPATSSGRLRAVLLRPLEDTGAALEALASAPRPGRAWACLGLGVVASWFVYVPLHELLHVAGCLLSGGRVSELQLDPIYGGTLLARVLPFVVPGGEYAGRLSGFDTGGSDLVYLATVFAPYLLSVGIGVPLLRCGARQPRPLRSGIGLVLGLAPFYNLPGDYYEMGSILATRAASWLGLGDFGALRSDDLPRLVHTLASQPQALELAGGSLPWAWLLVAIGGLLALLLAFLSYEAGRLFSDALARRR